MKKDQQVAIPGILGGMGPDASIDFMSKVVKESHASSDQDHLHLMLDHNPKVPSRQAAILDGGEDVGIHLAEMGKNLQKSGANFLVMVCNTAHAFESDIKAAVNIPFISIIDEVVEHLKEQWSDRIKVGVMATTGCLVTQLYQKKLALAGFNPVLWDESHLEEFMAVIYRIKAGERNDDITQKMNDLASNLIEKGAQILISGCTEIPLVLTKGNLDVPLLTSTDILVTSVIDYALGAKKLPTLNTK